MSAPTSSAAPTCPACGEPGSGRFCAACGAQLGGAACAGCAAPLSPGAKFCHRCGTPAGAAPARPAAGAPLPGVRTAPAGVATVLPWAVAFVAFLAIAAMAAGRNFNVRKGSGLDAPLNALPQAALGEGPGAGGAAAPGAPAAPFAGGAAGGRAPDLSQLSPRDIADRLFDRVMRLSSEGKVDSASFFADMALQNYAGMGDIDLDLRYDMGRVAEVAGRREVVQAQADTVLRRNPTHLLGLVLAVKAAAMAGDEPALAAAQKRLVAAEPGERTKNLDEYQRHRADIDAALAQARRP